MIKQGAECKSSALFIKNKMAKQRKKADRKVLRLKPGNHAFAGNHAVHNNDNTSSDALYWYLEHYPHIQRLLQPEVIEEIPTPEVSE